MHNVPLECVLHEGWISAPYLGEVAVFMHHIVGLLVVGHHFATVLENAPSDALDVIIGLTNFSERLCDYCKGLSLKDVLFYSVVKTTLSFASSRCHATNG